MSRNLLRVFARKTGAVMPEPDVAAFRNVALLVVQALRTLVESPLVDRPPKVMAAAKPTHIL